MHKKAPPFLNPINRLRKEGPFHAYPYTTLRAAFFVQRGIAAIEEVLKLVQIVFGRTVQRPDRAELTAAECVPKKPAKKVRPQWHNRDKSVRP